MQKNKTSSNFDDEVENILCIDAIIFAAFSIINFVLAIFGKLILSEIYGFEVSYAIAFRTQFLTSIAIWVLANIVYFFPAIEKMTKRGEKK